MFPKVAVEKVLQRRRGEEVFLTQAQFMPGWGCITWIKNIRDCLCTSTGGLGPDMVAGIKQLELQRLLRASGP
jgi:hypothetical protein